MAATTKPASRNEQLTRTIERVAKKRRRVSVAERIKGHELILDLEARRALPRIVKKVRADIIRETAIRAKASKGSRFLPVGFHERMKQAGLKGVREFREQAEGKFLIRQVKAAREAKRQKAAARRLPQLITEDERKTARRVELLRARDRKRREQKK